MAYCFIFVCLSVTSSILLIEFGLLRSDAQVTSCLFVFRRAGNIVDQQVRLEGAGEWRRVRFESGGEYQDEKHHRENHVRQ